MKMRTVTRPFSSASVVSCRPTRSRGCSQSRKLRQPITPLLQQQQQDSRWSACTAIPPEAIGVGLFLTPGALLAAFSLVKGKGNIRDGFSHVLTQLSQGYLQPDAGGKDIPVAEGDLSEFTGSYITFLYNQCGSTPVAWIMWTCLTAQGLVVAMLSRKQLLA